MNGRETRAYPTRAYLGLGSNLGDRLDHLRKGAEAIASLPETSVESVSPVYETAPWGVVDQPKFLNLCLSISTPLSARALLDAVLAIETRNGRSREIRWGPRSLDIDILAFGDEQIDEDGLTIPHSHLLKRMFVLKPLVDIAPNLSIRGRKIIDALAELSRIASENDELTLYGRLAYEGV